MMANVARAFQVCPDSGRRRSGRSGRRSLTILSVEHLEARLLLNATPAVRTIREATGADATFIQAAVDAFRTDLGDPNNGAASGSQGAGRREINWDGVSDGDAAPGSFPADFFNEFNPRGVVFSSPDPRVSFMVSADTVNSSVTGVRFDNLNGTYDTAFGTFSDERLFTPIGSNVTEVTFFVPGTRDRATVSGFGAVFTDVDSSGTSSIEFFDVTGERIFGQDVLATQGNASLSFLGVSFVGSPVAKVRITAGTAAVGPDDITQEGFADIVVLDDFLYGEPQPLAAPRIIVSSDRGAPPEVKVFNGLDGTQISQFFAYDQNFRGGVRVATGDVNGDGVADIITGPGKGMVSEVRVFSGVDQSQILSFIAFPPRFKSGVHLATANLNGDAFMDIIVSRDKGRAPANEPHVRVFDGQTGFELASFFAYSPAFAGGVTVAAGDINGDSLDDIITGSTTGNQPVRVFDATNQSLITEFFPFGDSFTGGVFVAAGDVNGDGTVDIITGASGRNSGSRVRSFNGTDLAEQLNQFVAFDSRFKGGVRVALGDVNNDGFADIVTGSGPRGGMVRNIGVTAASIDNFFAFGDTFTRGLFVAVCN